MSSSLAERKQDAKKAASTRNLRRFQEMRRWFPERPTIVSEGDSWFAYPSKWFFDTKPANLIDHISGWTKGKANFLTMASNGAEAVEMLSGDQKHELVKILRWHEGKGDVEPVDLLLFSGGGNDLVGENDFERFLVPYRPGMAAWDCVNTTRLGRKCKQIALAYEELADIRDQYSPGTVILTHTYDYPYPSLQGGEFLGGLICTKAWMKRFMDQDGIGIPHELQADVIKLFMDTMADELLTAAQGRASFVVAETRGVLRGKKHWLNEIHPDSEGFKALADVIYARMTECFPVLKNS